MLKILEKVERRLGEKLFLKGDRCVGPKCAVVRRGYPPGMHGKNKKRKRGPSEYGELLREKQKVRFIYGLDDKVIKRYTQEAASRPGIFSSNLLVILERRLDNVLFRAGFLPSRRMARKFISDGHVLVNGVRVTVPSYLAVKGDIVNLKDKIIARGILTDLEARLKKYEPPLWLELDKNKKEVRVKDFPNTDDLQVDLDVTKVKEFYSR